MPDRVAKAGLVAGDLQEAQGDGRGSGRRGKRKKEPKGRSGLTDWMMTESQTCPLLCCAGRGPGWRCAPAVLPLGHVRPRWRRTAARGCPPAWLLCAFTGVPPGRACRHAAHVYVVQL